METTSPPPPPPPPQNHVMQQSRKRPLLRPKHAALPYIMNLPVQETSPAPETQQDAPATPPPPVENGSVFPASEGPEDNPYHSEGKSGPVQETEPVTQTSPGPQVIEPRVEAVVQMDPATED
ncbi:formin-like protein 3 [Acanthopagrus latus]|uniref:formin-like protein 3 n=1 Tax=Acanthopagrus latus TaxID=8177 RepID=UPI00187C4B9E|nr:formin-like protein 3 [Acanthopagrus latus]